MAAVSKLSPILHRGTRKRIQPGWTDNPKGFAICDGCGLPCMHDDLRPNMDFRGGMTPVPTGTMVCGRCADEPQAYFQKQVLRPDPAPLPNPRPDDNGEVCGTIELESGEGSIELEDGSGLLALECWDYPRYPTGSLPSPALFPAGYQIDVTGLVDSPVRAYADTINWRRVGTNAVII